MAESHKTLQAVYLGHFVSVRRSGDFGRARKTANRGSVCKTLSYQKKEMCGSGREARARARGRVWYGGNGTIMLRKAICHV